MENQTQQTDILAQEEVVEQVAAETQLIINPEKLDEYLDSLRKQQSIPMGFLNGLGAAMLGAVVWAVVTVATEYQIGYMAVAIGLLVGFAVKTTGKGIDKTFGVMGAALALFGCLFGNFLSLVGFFANEAGTGYVETLNMIDYAVVPDVMLDTFSPMDILFYGIALWQGYKFSFRQITEEDIIRNAGERVETEAIPA